jgi:lipopolysaccharide heptosyltransferase I
MPEYPRILIIKPSSLGDIVHALPTVAALRAKYPQAHIAWLVKRQWEGIVERAEGVDRVWPVDGGLRGWLSQVSALRAAAFDLVVDLQGLFRSAAMARLTGCSTRVGFANGREGSPLFYTIRVPVATPEMHAVDRYLLAAAALGATVQPVPAARFRIRSEDNEAVRRLLHAHGLAPGDRWVAMNVSARWPTKRWPRERFAAVADKLQDEGAGRVVLIGGPDERTDAESLKALMRTAPVDLTGRTAPGLLPALLDGAALLITNDSGPMHVAAAVGTPVVAMFGPTSPVRTGPYGTGHAVLTHAVSCRPCFSRTCRNVDPLVCLKGIAPETVVREATRLLARDHEPSNVTIGRRAMDNHPDLTSRASW